MVEKNVCGKVRGGLTRKRHEETFWGDVLHLARALGDRSVKPLPKLREFTLIIYAFHFM